MKPIKIILLSLIIIFILLNCAVQADQDENLSKKIPDMIQDNYEHYIFKNGRKYLSARINKALFYNREKTIDCDRFYADIFNSKEELTTNIISDKGLIDNNENTVIFEGNVKVEMKDKEVDLTSDQLILNYKENTMISRNKVTIKKSNGSVLYAKSMNSDFKTNVTHFKEMKLDYFYEDETSDRTSNE